VGFELSNRGGIPRLLRSDQSDFAIMEVTKDQPSRRRRQTPEEPVARQASDLLMLRLLKEMGGSGTTASGFRSASVSALDVEPEYNLVAATYDE